MGTLGDTEYSSREMRDNFHLSDTEHYWNNDYAFIIKMNSYILVVLSCLCLAVSTYSYTDKCYRYEKPWDYSRMNE